MTIALLYSSSLSRAQNESVGTIPLLQHSIFDTGATMSRVPPPTREAFHREKLMRSSRIASFLSSWVSSGVTDCPLRPIFLPSPGVVPGEGALLNRSRNRLSLGRIRSLYVHTPPNNAMEFCKSIMKPRRSIAKTSS